MRENSQRINALLEYEPAPKLPVFAVFAKEDPDANQAENQLQDDPEIIRHLINFNETDQDLRANKNFHCLFLNLKLTPTVEYTQGEPQWDR